MKRYGMIAGVRPEKLEEYTKLHVAVWPDVLKMISQCHIQNYSIYLGRVDGRPYLFSYFEYTGSSFSADMARMAADPATQKWWGVCRPCLVPPEEGKGEWWLEMPELFHAD